MESSRFDYDAFYKKFSLDLLSSTTDPYVAASLFIELKYVINSKSELTKSYHNLSRKLHPDKGGNDNAFQALGHCYEILSKKSDSELEVISSEYGSGIRQSPVFSQNIKVERNYEYNTSSNFYRPTTGESSINIGKMTPVEQALSDRIEKQIQVYEDKKKKERADPAYLDIVSENRIDLWNSKIIILKAAQKALNGYGSSELKNKEEMYPRWSDGTETKKLVDEVKRMKGIPLEWNKGFKT